VKHVHARWLCCWRQAWVLHPCVLLCVCVGGGVVGRCTSAAVWLPCAPNFMKPCLCVRSERVPWPWITCGRWWTGCVGAWCRLPMTLAPACCPCRRRPLQTGVHRHYHAVHRHDHAVHRHYHAVHRTPWALISCVFPLAGIYTCSTKCSRKLVLVCLLGPSGLVPSATRAPRPCAPLLRTLVAGRTTLRHW
jgi:hypothetical protein